MIPVLTDLVKTYADEAKKIRELIELGSNRTTTGETNYTSLTSSYVYDTHAGSPSGSTIQMTDANVNNKGEDGLLYMLSYYLTTSVSDGGWGNCLITASYLATFILSIVTSSQIYAEDAGASDAYAVSLPNAPTSYSNGFICNFKANTQNSGDCTINVNGLGAKSIKTKEGSAPRTGTISSGDLVSVMYDGTNFRLMNSMPDIVTANLVQYKTDASGTDDYVITLDYPPAAYYTGMTILFTAATANTTAATINVNSLGAKSLKDINGTALVTGAIAANQPIHAFYDGTDFRILSTRKDVLTTNDTQTAYNKTFDSPSLIGNVTGWTGETSAWSVYTETKADGDINTGTSAVVTAVDVTTGTPVMFTTATPTGITIDTTYYAVRVDATHIKFATTLALALAGTAVTITNVGTGSRVLNIFDRFTVAGDQTAKYRVGTRLKWTQNSVVLYGTVSTSTYGTTTVVKIRGDMNYLGNYAISANYYSYQYAPSGYTIDSGWIAIPYSASYDASSDAQYRKINGIVYVRGTFTRDSSDVTNGDAMGVLPVGYRPNSPSGYLTTDATGASTTFTKISLMNDGQITVGAAPTSATTYVRIELSFPVD
jgi:hypothetical protein